VKYPPTIPRGKGKGVKHLHPLSSKEGKIYRQDASIGTVHTHDRKGMQDLVGHRWERGGKVLLGVRKEGRGGGNLVCLR